jgi:hypothetical protein
VETDADDAALEKLAQLTDRYCVVGQSLAKPPRLQIRRVGPNPGASSAVSSS